MQRSFYFAVLFPFRDRFIQGIEIQVNRIALPDREAVLGNDLKSSTSAATVDRVGRGRDGLAKTRNLEGVCGDGDEAADETVSDLCIINLHMTVNLGPTP
jgi:hypothetical protein